MARVLPIFTSHYSFSGRSILTLDEIKKDEKEINENKPVSILSIAKKHELNNFWLADYTLSGLIDAYTNSNKLGLNLRVGFKVVCCADIDDKSEKSFVSEHKIIVWLKNSNGYKNFIELVSKAQREGFYYVPRVDYKTLKEFWTEDLILSIPFYDSFIHKNTLEFGQCIPDFPCAPFLFKEQNNLPFDSILQRKVEELSKSENLEVVDVQSVFYYRYDDYKPYLVNKCINNQTEFEKPNLRYNNSNRFCFEEAQNKGFNFESNFYNSFSNLDLPFYGIRLPEVQIDPKIKENLNLKSGSDNFALLKSLCGEGFHKRYAARQIKENEIEWYRKQVQHELKILKTLGFVDYMLIVWDTINYCRNNDIPVGRGRGSSAGSAVAYLLGITDIPVKRHELLFERFLSADRAATVEKNGITYLTDAPDIDTDISKEQRYKVVEYLNGKYPGQTSKLINIATFQGKVLVKEVAKCVDNCEVSYLNKVTDLIPVEFGNVADIEECCNGLKNDKGEWLRKPIEDFKTFCEEYPESYRIALKLRGLAKNKSVHASGYLIAHCPINEFIPTELISDKKGNKHVASSFDMYSAGSIVIKIDLLGLKTLDILDNTAKLVGKKYDEIDIDDPSIYAYLSNEDAPYMGIFQAEDGLGRKTMKKIKVDSIDRIIDSITLGRPGAMDSIDDYCAFKNGTKFPNIDERVKDILGPTGGLLLFQEQLMALSVRMANFTPIESNGIRKAVGKKDKAKMLSYKERFLKGSSDSGYSPEYAQKTWDTFEASADYSFNRSHAASYAYNAACTAYFKANHTKEFFLSLLKFPPENGDKKDNFIPNIKKELNFFGIELIPPSLLKGNKDFIIEDDKNIRFGLNAIKGLAEAALSKLDNFKPENCNKFEMFEAAKQSGLSCGVMGALIMSGALDEFVDSTRSKLSFECLLFSKLKDKEKIYVLNKIKNGESDLIELVKTITDWTDSMGKKVARKTRLNTLRKDTLNYQEIYKNNRENEALTQLTYERTLLGFNYSSTLKEIFSKNGRTDIINLLEFRNELEPNKTAVIVCHVNEAVHYTSKKGNPTMKLFVEDETDSRFLYFSGRAYQEYLTECNNKPDIEAGNIIAIKIQKSRDGEGGFIQKVKKQGVKIFTKMAELKESQKEESEETEKSSIIPAETEAENPQTEMKLSG